MAQSRKIKIYQVIVDILGLSALVLVSFFYPDRRPFDTIFFMVLSAVAESQTIWMGTHETISISSAVAIAAMMVCGPTAAIWAAAVSVCGSFSRKNQKEVYHIFNTPFHLTVFNISNYALAVTTISMLYYLLQGRQIVARDNFTLVLRQISSSAPQLLVAVFAGVVCNALLFGLFQWISENVESIRQVFSYLIFPTINLFFICLFGVILTAVYVEYGWFMVTLLFLPFMLARYVFTTYKDLQQSYLQTVESLASAIETKDEYTSGHSRRVEQYSSQIAAEMKLSRHRCETIRYAALLHDIGKIGIPETVLNKPGRLTDEEMALIQQHPEKGAHIIEDIAFLSDAVEVIRCHHEWYNGCGYPAGKTGREMPLEAMILCVADSFDAMTTNRSYRHAMSREEAMEELRRGSGTQFCPEVVKAMEKVIGRQPRADKTIDIKI